MRTSIVIALLLVCTMAKAQEAYYQSGQLFVKLKNQSGTHLGYHKGATNNHVPEQWRGIVDSFGITQISNPFLVKDEKLQNTYLVLFSDSAVVGKLIQRITELDMVEYAEQVPLYTTEYIPNDYDPLQQWSLKQINAPQAWDINRDASHVVVAIVDDAVRITHRDLAPSVWTNPGEIPNNGIDDDHNGYIDDIHGWDVADNDNDPNPPSTASSSNFSHGTHCAGIAAGRSDNGTGIASISYNAKIMAVKTKASATAGGSLTNPYAGVDYAIAAHANVISMSWGGGGYSQTYQNLFDAAHNQGITLVAAAGNSNVQYTFFPAAYNHVISVGATSNTVPNGSGGFADVKASFSNYGNWIDVMAPGTNILSCWATNDSSYGQYSGTSMACPLVAGLAALMLGRDSLKTPDEIENCLKTTAINIDADNPNYIGFLGAGRIDAQGALGCAKLIIANFSSDYKFTCPNGTIHFYDRSQHNPISWQWSFPGGTPNVSNQQNPTVTYNTPGVYNVRLIASNSRGTDTITITNYVTVALPTASLGGSATVYGGYPAHVEVNFTGNPPWNCVLSNGTNNYPLNNITISPYYFTFVPTSSMVLHVVSMNDSHCSGTGNGFDTININSTPPPCNTIVNLTEHNKSNNNVMWADSQYFYGVETVNIGDINGDGIVDMAVGQSHDSITLRGQGAIWICFLNRFGGITGYQEITQGKGGFSGQLIYNNYFGGGICNLGDMDGDSINDLAVGAIGDRGPNGGAPVGAIYILFMNRNGTVKSQVKIDKSNGVIGNAINNNYGFGSSIANIGDLDGDGVKDIAVGNGGLSFGSIPREVMVIFLNRNGTPKSYKQITYGQNGVSDNSDGYQFASYVANIGDLDGDGIPEIGVSEIYNDSTYYPSTNNVQNYGKVWVFFLNRDGTFNRFHITHSPNPNTNHRGDRFGRNLASMGDFDGDGRPNIIAGATYGNYQTSNGLPSGKLWIMNLNSDGSIYDTLSVLYTTPPFALSTANFGTNFGATVDYLGDMDGDGGPEIVSMVLSFLPSGYVNQVTNLGSIDIISLSPCPRYGCRLSAAFKASKACAGTPVQFTDQSTDASSSQIVSWEWAFGDGATSSGVQNPTHTYSTAGTYQARLIVGNNRADACFDTIIHTVTVVSGFSVFTADTIHVCLGDTALLGITDSLCGTPQYHYSWSPTASLHNANTAAPTFVGQSSGTYNVTVTDALNHTATAHVYVKVDANCCHTKAAVNVPQPYYCQGTPVVLQNLSAASTLATYSWFDGINTYTGQTSPQLAFNAPGSYPVTLTVHDTCATKDTTVYVNVVAPPVAESRIDTTLCGVGNFTPPWQFIPDYSYSWLPTMGLSDSHSAAPVFSSGAPTLYVRTITDDATGCSATDTVNILQSGTSLSPINFGPDTVICYGEVLQLDATQNGTGITYQWQNGSTNPTHTATATGNYWVVVSSNCGIATDTIKVTVDHNLAFSLGNDTTVCNTSNLVIAVPPNFERYYWQGVLDTTSSHVVNVTGTYVLRAADKYQCEASDTIVVTVDNCNGIDEVGNSYGINVYPNPSEGLYHIAIDGLHVGDKVELEVLDILGRSLYKVADQSEQQRFTADIELRGYPAAMYLLRAKINQTPYFRNLILQK